MIDIVSSDHYSEHRRELDEMHRLRYKVFKARLGWDVQTSNGRERDRYDDLHPIYTLAINNEGALVGSSRLLPTTGPYMLRDVFPQLLDGHSAPSSPFVWESSRFAIDCGGNTECCLAFVNRITAEIFCGIIEFCLTKGIRQVVGVYDIRFAAVFSRAGGHPKWQTRPQRIGNTLALAGLFDIHQALLMKVRATCGISGSVLRSASNQREWLAA